MANAEGPEHNPLTAGATTAPRKEKPMYGRLFTLTSAEDQNLIFAWGMEIIGTGEREAVIYRRDPVTGQTLHAVHDSADAALARYDGRPEPMSLVWMDVPIQVDNLWELLDTALNG